jgi:hypothetical protein
VSDGGCPKGIDMTHFDDLLSAHGRQHGYAADPLWARRLAVLVLLVLLLSL